MSTAAPAAPEKVTVPPSSLPTPAGGVSISSAVGNGDVGHKAAARYARDRCGWTALWMRSLICEPTCCTYRFDSSLEETGYSSSITRSPVFT